MTAIDEPPAADAGVPPAPRRRRVARSLLVAMLLVGIPIGLLVDPEPLVVVPLLFVLVVPFEKLFPRHQQRIRRPQLRTDLAYAVAAPAFGAVTIAVAVVVGVASLAWVPGLALRPVVDLLSGPARLVAAFVLFDLATYWVHRWSHEWPMLWKVHSIHHSTRHLDWISGLRVHPLDGALLAPPFVLLLAAGFDAETAGVLAVVQLLLGLFLHANVRWRLRPLQRIVATPEFHHWHHSIERDAYCSNYAVYLPLWDQIFGTWFMPPDRRPEAYGVADPVPDDMVGQLLYPLRGEDGLWVRSRHPLRSIRSRRSTRRARRAVGAAP